MKKLLIKYTPYFSSETNPTGHYVTNEEDWNTFVEICNIFTYSIDYYFGINNLLTYENGQKLLKDFSAEDISDAEIKTLEKLGLVSSAVTGPNLEDELEQIIQDPDIKSKFFSDLALKMEKENLEAYNKQQARPLSEKVLSSMLETLNIYSYKNTHRDAAGIIVDENYLIENCFEKTYEGKFGSTWERVVPIQEPSPNLGITN